MTEPSSKGPMPDIVNLDRATFECTFGRGCEGICCRNGRPPVDRQQSKRIDANIEKFLPLMRVEARAVVEKAGYLSRRGTPEEPLVRVVAGWCVFFNKGCVLHAVGAHEGDKNRYKPSACALFPLVRDWRGRCHVRQHGYNRELWDLFCLKPSASTMPSRLSLQDEIALARKLMQD
jgi:hypothetical protein